MTPWLVLLGMLASLVGCDRIRYEEYNFTWVDTELGEGTSATVSLYGSWHQTQNEGLTLARLGSPYTLRIHLSVPSDTRAVLESVVIMGVDGEVELPLEGFSALEFNRSPVEAGRLLGLTEFRGLDLEFVDQSVSVVLIISQEGSEAREVRFSVVLKPDYSEDTRFGTLARLGDAT